MEAKGSSRVGTPPTPPIPFSSNGKSVWEQLQALERQENRRHGQQESSLETAPYRGILEVLCLWISR